MERINIPIAAFLSMCFLGACDYPNMTESMAENLEHSPIIMAEIPEDPQIRMFRDFLPSFITPDLAIKLPLERGGDRVTSDIFSQKVQETKSTVSKPKILILSHHDNSSLPMVQLAHTNHCLYAKKHNYACSMRNGTLIDKGRFHDSSEGTKPRVKALGLYWQKIAAVEQALYEKDEQTGKQKWDWVFWLDADALFHNFDISIEQILSSHEEKEFFIAQDHYFNQHFNEEDPGIYLNSGVFIVKNTNWGKDFIQKIANLYPSFKDLPYPEQMAIDALVYQHIDVTDNGEIVGERMPLLFADEKKLAKRIHHKVAVLSEQELNKELNPLISQAPVTSIFIYHAYGCQNQKLQCLQNLNKQRIYERPKVFILHAESHIDELKKMHVPLEGEDISFQTSILENRLIFIGEDLEKNMNLRSHVKLLQSLKEDEEEDILVLKMVEAKLPVHFFEKVDELMLDLPPDWDIAFFGDPDPACAKPHLNSKLTDLKKDFCLSGLSAYVINKNSIQRVLETFKFIQGLGGIQQEKFEDKALKAYWTDSIFAEVEKKTNN